MIKPITIYGNPVLRKECVNIDETYPSIREVIETMWQTLRNADGCGQLLHKSIYLSNYS